MLPENNFKAVCSVTEMAKKVSLSRPRFYQLQKKGIFPEPVYIDESKRPFYPLDLQQKCVEIRKTGIGHNGQIVIFNASRKKECNGHADPLEHQFEQLADALRQMGRNVTVNKVKNAVKTLYPEGLTQRPLEGSVIGELYRYFENEGCKNAV